MKKNVPRPPIWANLVHLSYNMWFDCPESLFKNKTSEAVAKPYLRFDERLWRDILRAMSAAGMNMVVLDLGDGVAYRSHPEIAAKRLYGFLQTSWRATLEKHREQHMAAIAAVGAVITGNR